MPDYKSPAIEEAICEFIFAPNPAAPSWDLTLPGRLQVEGAIKQDYPGPSRQQHRQSVVATNPQGKPVVSLTDELFRVQLPSTDQKAILAVGQDALSVSVLKPYEGWGRFKPRIARALDTYIKIAQPPPVIRIGLRYINRLVVPVATADVAARFLATVQTSIEAVSLADNTKITGKLTAMNARHEFITSEGFRLYITHATLQPAMPNTSEYLLDIDTVWDQTPMDDPTQIMPHVDRCHVVAGSLFERLITDETRAILNAN
jgi:uncharacterized protein (TIGR04255 family)